MSLLSLVLFITALFASGVSRPDVAASRGEEAQKLANAMGADLDMSAITAATDAWKRQQTQYERVKHELTEGVNAAYTAANQLKEETEKLDSAKNKKNIEDSGLEQKAVNFLAMQMIKERKATKDMAKERDEALVYVPKLKKHQAEDMQKIKDAAIKEAEGLNERIKEEEKRRVDQVNEKVAEIDDLGKKMDAAITEEKGRTAAAVKEGQNNVEKARTEFAEERNQMLGQISKLNDQNKADLAVKDEKIKGLEQTVEDTRQQGVDAVAAEKQTAENERKTLEGKYTQELQEKDDSYKTQIAGINSNLEETQNEVNDLQGKLVESNAQNQQALTEKQKELDATVSSLKDRQKQKITEIETAAAEDKKEALAALQQTADAKVAQTESNSQTRLQNMEEANKKVVDRLEAQKTRMADQLQKEGETLDDVNAKLRKANQENLDLRSVLQENQRAAQQAASLTTQNLNIPSLDVSSSAATVSGTTAGTAELQVAATNTAPINMKFVGVLVGVNALLACVAFTYYSESKKLQSFQATFLEEF